MSENETTVSFGAKVEGLKPNTQMERGRGMAEGVFYAGVAATGRQGPSAPTFTLIADDAETLEGLWDQLMYPKPLNRKATYNVCIFQRSDVKESIDV